jgi:hypothetical protein
MGRDIEEGDREGAPRVCVINQAFARRFFDGRNPIGLHITTVEDDGRRVAYEVVGVAGDMHNFGLREPVTPRYFTAANQPPTPGTSPTFLMRTAPGVAPPIDAVRAAIRRVDPSLPIMSVRTFSQQVAPLTAQDRVTAQLAICFGVVALALAAVGLYGVLSYGVARRRGEIAIRIALGALPRAVVTMILKDTGRVLGVGVALGGVLSYVAAKLIAGRLYGITPEDPVTLVSATLLLAAVAVTAAFLPARRASKVEPVSALRG